MRRVRVLQVITGLGPGGAERSALDLVSRMNPREFDVRLVSIVSDSRALHTYGHESTAFTSLAVEERGPLAAALKLRHICRAFQPDVVHAHMFHGLLATVAATCGYGIRPSICFTSHRSEYSPFRTLVVRRLRRFRDTDIIFEEGQHPELNAPTTTVIPNGVSVEGGPAQRIPWNRGGAIRILSVGRLAGPKDPLGMLRSFAQAAIPFATLDVVGDGPLLPAARALAHELGLEHRVRFHGLQRDVRSYMRKSDVFILHSLTEGMPMALLEAGAEGMPVLSTPVGSVPKLLADSRGWVADRLSFGEALGRIADDPTNALRSGTRLHEYVRMNHSLEQIVARHESLYQSLAANDEMEIRRR